MTTTSNSNLPDSVTGDLESAQIRDPSALVTRIHTFRYLFNTMVIFSLLTIACIPLPSAVLSLSAKETLPFMLLFFVAGAILFHQMNKKWHKFTPDEGSSKINKKEWVPVFDEFLLGYDMDTGEPETVNFDDITDHMTFCTGSGGGKTTFNNTLLYQALKKNCPVIYFNGKKSSDNAKRATYIAEAAGALHRLRMIDPGESYTHVINPTMSTNDIGKIANKILNILPVASQEGGAAHYRQQTYRYIVQLVEVLLYTGKTFTYEDILTFISQTQLAVEVLEEELKSKGKHHALQQLASMFLSMDAKAKKDSIFRKMREDMSGLEAQLQALVTLKAGKFICSNKPSFSFAEAINKNHFIFAQIPTLQDMEQADMLSNVLFLEMMEGIGAVYDQEGKLPKPCIIFLEELSSYAQQTLSLLFMQAREANIALIPFLQVPDSLQKRERGLTPEFMEEIMGNAGRQYWGKMRGKAGREWAAESFGKTIRMFASVSRGEMSGHSGKRFDAERFVNPQQDQRETKTVGWSEQLDDMVHAPTLADLNAWETLTYRDGRLRRVVLNHTFVSVPPDYNLNEKVPKITYHGNSTSLDLTKRVDAKVQARIRESSEGMHYANKKDSDDPFA